MVKKVREFFNERYSYINLQEISDSQIEAFMRKSYLKDLSFEKQMDLLQDWVVSQGLCEVVE